MSNNYLNNDVLIENIKFVILSGIGFFFLFLGISCYCCFFDLNILLFLMYAFLFYDLSFFALNFAFEGVF